MNREFTLIKRTFVVYKVGSQHKAQPCLNHLSAVQQHCQCWEYFVLHAEALHCTQQALLEASLLCRQRRSRSSLCPSCQLLFTCAPTSMMTPPQMAT